MPDVVRHPTLATANAEFLPAIDLEGWEQIVHAPIGDNNTPVLIFTLGITGAFAEVGLAFPDSDQRIATCPLECLSDCINRSQEK
jgi:hypothetical protein